MLTKKQMFLVKFSLLWRDLILNMVKQDSNSTILTSRAKKLLMLFTLLTLKAILRFIVLGSFRYKLLYKANFEIYLAWLFQI